jgi:hypothetical protein
MCPLTFAALPILARPTASAELATERSLTLRQRRDRRIPTAAAGLGPRTASTDWRHHEPGRHLPAAG